MQVLKKTSSSSSNLSITHGKPQKEYLEELIRLLKPLNLKLKSLISKAGFNAGKESFYTKSNNLVYLDNIRKEFYYPKKEVSKQLLSKLDDVALSFWLMDDGKLKFTKRDGFSSWYLHTEGFNKQSIDNICEWLNNKYGLNSRPHKRENTAGYCVYFTSESTRKIMPQLAQYFCPTMHYKLYPQYRSVPYILEKFEGKSIDTFLEVAPDKKIHANNRYKSSTARKKYRWKNGYSITVEDNHNFICNGFILCDDTV